MTSLGGAEQKIARRCRVLWSNRAHAVKRANSMRASMSAAEARYPFESRRCVLLTPDPASSMRPMASIAFDDPSRAARRYSL